MEVEVPNQSGRLKPGMYARVRLISAKKEGALVVPKAALVTSQDRRGVYMVQKGQAVFRAVGLGLEEPERVEIVDGLKEGDEVVTTGASSLRDGAKVLVGGPVSNPVAAGRPVGAPAESAKQ